MKRIIAFALPLILIGTISNGQALKQPHTFTIGSGIAIQNKILQKPGGMLPKLSSGSILSAQPVYRSISSAPLEALKTGVAVLDVNEHGFPSRIRTAAPAMPFGRPTADFWSGQLKQWLGLSQQSGAEFILRSEEADELGIRHLKFDQTFDGTPVLNQEYFIHRYADQTIMAHGSVALPDQVLEAAIPPDATLAKAKSYLEKKGVAFAAEQPDRPHWIKLGLQDQLLAYWYDATAERWHLVYQMDLFPDAMSRWMVLLDAVTGDILKAHPNQCLLHGSGSKEHAHVGCQHEEFAPQGGEVTTARDLFDINRTLNVWREGSTVYMIDGSRPMFKPASFRLDDPVGAIWTVDGLNSNPDNIRIDQVKSTSNTWSKTAVSAHYNAGVAFEYYTNTHARNSINGKGGTIISVINIIDENGGGLDNAFWNGEAMFYGNGASAFFPLARGLDVAGHEMSHGVIQSTANLVYEGEPGAINESFADVFGAMIDRNDWKIGEDVVKLSAFPSGALRDMSDPHNGAATNDFGRWQPRHVNEQYKGSADNGGVHINSGIPNYAYYLFVQELAKSGGEEQGKKTAEKVYYRTLNQYLTRSSNFMDLRTAVEQACVDLHGANSAVLNAAKLAFSMVGIGAAPGNPGGGNYQKDLPVNPGKEFVVCTDDLFDGVYLADLTTSQINVISNRSIKSKPSVTDDGAEIYFVGDDSKLYALFFNSGTGLYQEFVLDSDPIYRNACISKDGALLAVLYEQEENKIHVYRFTTQTWSSFTLTNPTTQNGVSTSNVRYADFMDFEPSGQHLMYDCLSKLEKSTGGSYEYWDIGFLRVFDRANNNFADGHIEKLFSNIPENTSVGNPVFSKNSPYIIAFDYLEESLFGSTFSILGANIETGDVGEIAINRDDTGYPSYSVKDDVLLFDGVNANQETSLKIKPLAQNKIQSNGSEQVFINGARWGAWFANGKRNLIKVDDVHGITGITCSPNPFNEGFRLEMQSQRSEDLTIALYDVRGRRIFVQTHSVNAGENRFYIDPGPIETGMYFLSLQTREGKTGVLVSKMND